MICSILTSCDKEYIRASNEISIKFIDVSDFTKLEIANDFNAYITFSDTKGKIKIEEMTTYTNL